MESTPQSTQPVIPPQGAEPVLPQAPVEDLFGDTLSSPTTQKVHSVPPPVWPPVSQQQLMPVQREVPETANGRLPRSRFFLLIGVCVAAIIVVGIVYGPAVWKRLFTSGTATGANLNQVQPLQNTTIPTRTNQQLQGPVVDSDGDGLLDSEEQTLGTNSATIDSDGDGLTDRQEIRIYNTNPTIQDTDRDGYNDGDEVRNFYNPNGSGRLLDVLDIIDGAQDTQTN